MSEQLTDKDMSDAAHALNHVLPKLTLWVLVALHPNDDEPRMFTITNNGRADDVGVGITRDLLTTAAEGLADATAVAVPKKDGQ